MSSSKERRGGHRAWACSCARCATSTSQDCGRRRDRLHGPDQGSLRRGVRSHAEEARLRLRGARARAREEADNARFPPSLIPTDYFVQNVVDLQDLLGLRHCVFAIGLSGNNKSTSRGRCSPSAGRAATGKNPAGIGKTIWKDINPKSITPNELYGYINIATREWKDGMLSVDMRDMAERGRLAPQVGHPRRRPRRQLDREHELGDGRQPAAHPRLQRAHPPAHEHEDDLRDPRPRLRLARDGHARRRALHHRRRAVEELRPGVDRRLGGEGLTLPRSAEKMRAEFREVGAKIFEKYCRQDAARRSRSTTSMLCHCSTSGSCRPSPTSCRACGRSRTSATRTSAIEIYFVFACVWGFGGRMSITVGHRLPQEVLPVVEGHVEGYQIPAPRRGVRRLRRQGEEGLRLVVGDRARARVRLDHHQDVARDGADDGDGRHLLLARQLDPQQARHDAYWRRRLRQDSDDQRQAAHSCPRTTDHSRSTSTTTPTPTCSRRSSRRRSRRRRARTLARPATRS